MISEIFSNLNNNVSLRFFAEHNEWEWTRWVSHQAGWHWEEGQPHLLEAEVTEALGQFWREIRSEEISVLGWVCALTSAGCLQQWGATGICAVPTMSWSAHVSELCMNSPPGPKASAKQETLSKVSEDLMLMFEFSLSYHCGVFVQAVYPCSAKLSLVCSWRFLCFWNESQGGQKIKVFRDTLVN